MIERFHHSPRQYYSDLDKCRKPKCQQAKYWKPLIVEELQVYCPIEDFDLDLGEL
jgi:hypothetical protein